MWTHHSKPMPPASVYLVILSFLCFWLLSNFSKRRADTTVPRIEQFISSEELKEVSSLVGSLVNYLTNQPTKISLSYLSEGLLSVKLLRFFLFLFLFFFFIFWTIFRNNKVQLLLLLLLLMWRCLIINDELWIRVNVELNGQNVNKNFVIILKICKFYINNNN